MPTKYLVCNPRHIDPDLPIFRGVYNDIPLEWRIGQLFEPPEGMTDADIQWLLGHGLIVPWNDEEPDPTPSPGDEPAPVADDVQDDDADPINPDG